MESALANKKHCTLCKRNISIKNWAEHLSTLKHLRSWAQHEGIADHRSMSVDQLKEVQTMMELGRTNYAVYTIERLRQLAAGKRLNEADSLSRRKLVKRLQKADDYPHQKLYLFNHDEICDRAAGCGIITDNLTKDQLINLIYKKKKLVYCPPCKLAVSESHKGLHDASVEHCRKVGSGLQEEVELTRNGHFKTTIFNNTVEEFVDIEPFLDTTRHRVLQLLNKHTQSGENIKVYMTVECDYQRDTAAGGVQFTTMSFHTKAQEVYTADDKSSVISTHFADLSSREKERQPTAGSGWSLSKVKRLIVRKATFRPLAANSYIDLPKWVKDKHACINIHNKDQKCFVYSILCALDEPSRDPQRASKYADKLNDEIFHSFEYPMSLKDINSFERKSDSGYPNYPSMAINVFEIGSKSACNRPRFVGENSFLKDDIRPILISKRNKSAQKIIDLLLIHNDTTQHYVLIKDLARLVGSQLSKSNRRVYICRQCLSHFYSQEHLDSHQELCGDENPCHMNMPPEGSRVRFRHHVHKFPHPYVIYADFETLGVKLDEQSGKNSRRMTKHVPYGFTIYLVSRVNGEKFEPAVFRAKTQSMLRRLPQIFIKKLHKLVEGIADKYANRKPLVMSQADEGTFSRALTCHICGGQFDDTNSKWVKVRDHCHLEGHFLGAAHQKCNLDRSLVTNIPCILHNLSKFDSHLFIDKLFHYNDNSKTTVIANTEETYISIQKNLFKVSQGEKFRYFKLTFVDSLRFLSSSIEKLANNLERDQFKHLNRFIDNGLGKYLRMNKNRAFQLLRGKGTFPYDFVDSLEKLEQNTLLPKEDFFNILTDEHISDTDYYRYKYTWHCLRKQTLGRYSDLYNIQDVLLLSDIFENFREVCLENYQLDPAYYLTAPSLSWDAMLKKTRANIELVSDPDMHLMLERGIRGGIAQICKRHVVANNTYLDNFDDTKPENYLMYFDACNLYGWALSQKLPYKNFRWVHPCPIPEGWENLIMNHNENGYTGYFFEVDLEYSGDLHKAHSDVPFAPVHFNKKLCTTLHDKAKYIVHVTNLKQMLANGLKLTRVYRCLSFTQRDFMRPYIQFNSDRRKNARNEFEKNFYKLMVNSVFGRTMMNLRKRRNIRLCTEAQAYKLCKKPSFSRWTIFSDDFLACHLAKNRQTFNQPIQVGCAVLELSKWLMYDFMYNKLKVWDPEVNLILMDTDSYLVEMMKDPYEIMQSHLDDFDTSNYPETSPLFRDGNKSVPGKMKDELGGVPLSEVFGLRPKLYYFEYKGKHQIRAKGVKQCVTKNRITRDHFFKALYDREDHYTDQTNITSKKHVLYTERQRKLAVSGRDDKRFILPNGIETLPWGHHSIPDRDPSEASEQSGIQ